MADLFCAVGSFCLQFDKASSWLAKLGNHNACRICKQAAGHSRFGQVSPTPRGGTPCEVWMQNMGNFCPAGFSQPHAVIITIRLRLRMLMDVLLQCWCRFFGDGRTLESSVFLLRQLTDLCYAVEAAILFGLVALLKSLFLNSSISWHFLGRFESGIMCDM